MPILSEDEASRINSVVVPIRFAGPVSVQFEGAPGPEEIAVLQLATAHRPELADLGRVLHYEDAPERQLDPLMFTLGDNPAMIISLRMTEPVNVDAVIVLHWDKYRDFLLLLAKKDLWITFGELEDLFKNSLGIRTAGAEELLRALQQWQADDEARPSSSS